MLLGEALMTFLPLGADACNLKPCGNKFAMQIANRACLFSAARRKIRRIEIQNDRSVFQQSLQGYGLAGLVGERE